ncbi:hypothetical protein HPB51_025633 [Rhipicephalus microplus]|uniref:Uncharacterized protein n=1 Tax=Rhipicephalus microplus TaxID=6941 RepID=A0A9J6F8N6_RHIMP|nr:hypothetical protein HPB51_025633 [Rhipicephalus microplus]
MSTGTSATDGRARSVRQSNSLGRRERTSDAATTRTTKHARTRLQRHRAGVKDRYAADATDGLPAQPTRTATKTPQQLRAPYTQATQEEEQSPNMRQLVASMPSIIAVSLRPSPPYLPCQDRATSQPLCRFVCVVVDARADTLHLTCGASRVKRAICTRCNSVPHDMTPRTRRSCQE